jgi:hypothetical protein
MTLWLLVMPKTYSQNWRARADKKKQAEQNAKMLDMLRFIRVNKIESELWHKIDREEEA